MRPGTPEATFIIRGSPQGEGPHLCFREPGGPRPIELMGSPTPLRRELLLSFGVLFVGAILVAVAGLAFVLPVTENPGEATLLVLALLVADLLVLFVFGRVLLRRTLLNPIDNLVQDARRIADGDFRHRMSAADTQELQALSASMNAMAERLIRDQRLLAENVRSLEETNRQLVLARDQVVRSARLASVGTLAAGLAHEVGNPLGAIMAYLDVAKGRTRGDSGIAELVESTMAEARRIDRIIRSLLDYARPNRDVTGPADPASVVERVRSLLEAQGRFDGVRVDWVVDDDIGPVLIDTHHLEQILVNLLLNAVDALEGQTERSLVVSLREEQRHSPGLPRRRQNDPPGVNYAHRRRLPKSRDVLSPQELIRETERVVILEVRDNGPGMADDVLEHLFDPFFTTKQPGKGTGLGLAICARLAEEMGATIDARNGPEGGALFVVTLPGTAEWHAGGSTTSLTPGRRRTPALTEEA